jgi:hypothetical protein
MFGFPNASRGFQIDPRLRQFAEKVVGLLLLLKRLIGRSAAASCMPSCVAQAFNVP